MSFFRPFGNDGFENARPVQRIDMKPTIRRCLPRADGMCWLCVGLGFTGEGYTPADAYNNWTRGFRNGRKAA